MKNSGKILCFFSVISVWMKSVWSAIKSDIILSEINTHQGQVGTHAGVCHQQPSASPFYVPRAVPTAFHSHLCRLKCYINFVFVFLLSTGCVSTEVEWCRCIKSINEIICMHLHMQICQCIKSDVYLYIFSQYNIN